MDVINPHPPNASSTSTSSTLDVDAFRLLVESTVDYAIFMLDPEGFIVSWNTGAQRIKGYQADEIIGRHFSTFYPQEAIDRGWPQHELEVASRTGRFEDEGWRVRKDGSQFWANVVITAVKEADGALRGFAKVTRDITLRREHEERITKLTDELKQRVIELDTTNRVLAHRNVENESFVFSVSHDLRSPLVNLQGFSQELMLTAQGLRQVLSSPRIPDDLRTEALALLGGELDESVAFIRNAVKQLGNIIDGLLRLSRIGRIEYEHVVVELDALVREILSAMHTTVAESGARVQLGPLPRVDGDRNAIGQVFANIIGNALKSLDPNRPGLIEIFAIGTPPVFAVRDNGVGIPDEYRQKMFQVFQQVHPGPKRGEGMGLAIVRRIIERHGGRIWYESTPGEGTTFYFTLQPAKSREPGLNSR